MREDEGGIAGGCCLVYDARTLRHWKSCRTRRHATAPLRYTCISLQQVWYITTLNGYSACTVAVRNIVVFVASRPANLGRPSKKQRQYDRRVRNASSSVTQPVPSKLNSELYHGHRSYQCQCPIANRCFIVVMQPRLGFPYISRIQANCVSGIRETLG